MIDRHLSIWEIAHRWRDVNPDKTDPADVPLNVQDALRYICRGILAGKLGLFHMAVMDLSDKKSSFGFRSEIRPIYLRELPNGIEEALYRNYDKDALNSHFIEAENFFDYCLYEQIESSTSGNQSLDFPDFWWSFNGLTPTSSDDSEDQIQPIAKNPQSLRPAQIDKLVCQAIARTLWDEHPLMTIAAMTEHNAIQEYGGGKLYQGKNTLRDWLSKVAPENVKRAGRPPKAKPNSDAT